MGQDGWAAGGGRGQERSCLGGAAQNIGLYDVTPRCVELWPKMQMDESGAAGSPAYTFGQRPNMCYPCRTCQPMQRVWLSHIDVTEFTPCLTLQKT
eukprot:365663-Chlamydomonas_euryale.AAC.17